MSQVETGERRAKMGRPLPINLIFMPYGASIQIYGEAVSSWPGGFLMRAIGGLNGGTGRGLVNYE